MSIIDTFDAISEEVLRPDSMTDPVPGFPETVVITFHDRIIDALKAMCPVEIISELHAGFSIPLYKFDFHGRELGLYMTSIGGAATTALMEEVAVKGAELLLPVFERERGLKGRLSIQTNPTYYRDAARIVDQAVRFAGLAPNMQVKIPVTQAGVRAIEEATFAGVNINATVCFCVPQAMAGRGDLRITGVPSVLSKGLRSGPRAGVPNSTRHMRQLPAMGSLGCQQ